MGNSKEISEEIKIQSCKTIISFIEDYLLSLRKAVVKFNDESNDYKISPSTFLFLIEQHNLTEQYARVCAARQEALFDDIIDLSDGDKYDVDDPIKVSRNKLQIDARKWALSKMNPKKYGDKVDITSDHEKIEGGVTIFQLPDNGRD